uniref:Uncharacterized protein n=1 Tax=Candidatus Kentrum sp. SD TaxID=2126332 RepID=A0A451BQL3_9GAMM|nr:MAG: hypothetical protein BECKSD772F_GA0070984_11226 [Candidatus Kentron sp. SD]VFK48245.1 MAG: hypothetical protein BECKSD772E_GA0070983_11187 [Candidatus Kentron sp. SD]VFK80609.1 MAG: hypothetical protein BECKSD772D_GA0070982_11337 [Candidatus Kentron sp. SD]
MLLLLPLDPNVRVGIEYSAKLRLPASQPQPHKNQPNPKEPSRPNQNTDASLSPADIKAAFDTVLQKMPFLINLTPKERKSTFKADPDSVSFV